MRRRRENRSRLVRDYLEQHRGTAFTAREVATAVAPGDKVDLVHATLANLARAGHAVKLGAGYGNVHFTAADGFPKRKRNSRSTDRAAASPALPGIRRGYPTQSQLAEVHKRLETKPLRETITGLAVNPKRGRRAPLRVANFTAAPGTTDMFACPARRASAQIAADIAEFEAQGGVIERLGPTIFFHHEDVANDDDQP